jgi:hypothetical protein
MPKMEKEDQKQVQKVFQGIAKPHNKKYTSDRDEYDDWKQQFDLFVDQAEIPARHKMVMLKSALGGKPLKLVENLGYTEKQHELALHKLDLRYGGNRRTLQKHIEKLNSLPRVRMDESHSIEEFADQLYDTVVKMSDGGREAELQGDSAMYTNSIERYARSLLMRYYETKPEEDRIATFADWLMTYVSRRLELYQIRMPVKKTSEHARKPDK